MSCHPRVQDQQVERSFHSRIDLLNFSHAGAGPVAAIPHSTGSPALLPPRSGDRVVNPRVVQRTTQPDCT